MNVNDAAGLVWQSLRSNQRLPARERFWLLFLLVHEISLRKASAIGSDEGKDSVVSKSLKLAGACFKSLPKHDLFERLEVSFLDPAKALLKLTHAATNGRRSSVTASSPAWN